jgi:hypothetical protein
MVVNEMAEQKLDLDDFVLIGRTFDEYYDMFNLSNIDMKRDKILDVASGVSSFCSEAAALGYDVTACDQIYNFSTERIQEKASSDLTQVMGKMPQVASLYLWNRYQNIDALRKNREMALKLFSQDYTKNRQNYIHCEFPTSGFEKEAFTITLVSHLLFLYDEQLDYEFHREAVFEMLRISSKEVRIFPLVNFKGQKSKFVRKIIKEAFDKGYGISIDKVGYEFVKNGNEMLRIQK